jgi:hypothetical protein
VLGGAFGLHDRLITSRTSGRFGGDDHAEVAFDHGWSTTSNDPVCGCDDGVTSSAVSGRAGAERLES